MHKKKNGPNRRPNRNSKREGREEKQIKYRKAESKKEEKNKGIRRYADWQQRRGGVAPRQNTRIRHQCEQGSEKR